MAFIAPAIPYIIAGLSAAGTVYGANEQRKASVIESRETLKQAKAEEISAAQRQIERRRNLLRSLSSQNAAAGAAGVGLEGSTSAIAKADIRDATNDLLIDDSNSDQRISSLRSQASNARRLGNAQFGSSLLKAGSDFYGATGGSGGQKSGKKGSK